MIILFAFKTFFGETSAAVLTASNAADIQVAVYVGVQHINASYGIYQFYVKMLSYILLHLEIGVLVNLDLDFLGR